MNFLKKFVFGTSKQQPKQNIQLPTQNQQQNQIPQEVLSQLFQKSAKYIAQSSKPISDQHKLLIYGLYKQATIGDCNTPKPSMLDFVGKSKWNAWENNKGISKSQAMKIYISKAVEIDPQIQNKMHSFLQDGNQIQSKSLGAKQKPSSALQSGVGMKMVQQKDYSESYSHPYFKLIEKGLPLQDINHQILLKLNSSPKCYALHFAIDKQRVDLVKKFLEILSAEEILQMKDEDGTSIEEYAQLIENEEIIDLVKQKIGKQ